MSGKRDSNSRPRPWQGRALPTELLPHVVFTLTEAIEWPRLDVDLEIDSLRYPERYPLLIKRTPSELVEA